MESWCRYTYTHTVSQDYGVPHMEKQGERGRVFRKLSSKNSLLLVAHLSYQHITNPFLLLVFPIDPRIMGRKNSQKAPDC
jgi:hypothetical protein